MISAEIPINLVGEPVEVNHGDGIVDQQLFTLTIKAKPADIPPSVDIDISGLTIGASLHVSDITVPRGVELETDPEATVVAGQPPRVQATAEEEAEAAASPSKPPRRRRPTQPTTPSPPRARSCSATGAARRGPRTGTPADFVVVGLGNPGRSSRAPATMSGPRWPPPWPTGTRGG